MSAYVEAQDAIDITRGRTDELSEIAPSTCNIVLDNKDGRFTPGYASGAYYPNVKKGRPVRVSAVWVLGGGGTTYRRFTGYIDDWGLEWPDPGAGMSTVTISASSRQARLGRDAGFNNSYGQNVLTDAPYMYYPLGDASGATSAANASGVTTTPASVVQVGSGGTLTFGDGVGPAYDGLSAAVYDRAGEDDGKLLRAFFGEQITTSATGHLAIEAWVVTTTSTGTILSLGSKGSHLNLYVTLGDIEADYNEDDSILTGMFEALSPLITDGLLHHVVVTLEPSGGSILGRLYYDGVQVDTQAAMLTLAQFDALTADGGALRIGSNPAGSANGVFMYEGTVAHAAVYTTELTAARIAAHYEAGATGYEGESSDERIDRYAEWSGIPTAEVSTETGVTTSMTSVDTTNLAPITAMQDTADTEGGIVFDAGDGTLTFHARSHRHDTTTSITLSATTQQVQTGLQPKLDDQGLVNDLTVAKPDGSAQVRVVNQDSVDEVGIYADSREVASTVDAEVEQYANWTVGQYGEPNVRIPNVSVQLMGLASATITSLLALELGDRITLSGLPTQAPASSMDFFIEGYSESIRVAADGESWLMTFNLSPAELFDVWVLEDAVYGAYDTYPLSY
jgi:hypothetical protein